AQAAYSQTGRGVGAPATPPKNVFLIFFFSIKKIPTISIYKILRFLLKTHRSKTVGGAGFKTYIKFILKI
ncbi:hypothetical protein, partial [Enterobacter asburiae]